MNKKLAVLAIAATGMATAAHAEEGLYGGLMGTVVKRDHSLNLDAGYGGMGLIGAPLSPRLNWEANAFYGVNDMNPPGGKVPGYGLGLDLRYALADGHMRPFLLGGIGGEIDDYKDAGLGRKTGPFANLGLGVTVQSGEKRAFRAEVRGYALNYKTFPGDNTQYDLRFNFGVTFGGLGKSSAPVAAAAAPATPPPAAPVEPSKPAVAAAPLAPAPAAPAAAPVQPAPAALERFALKGVTFDTASAKIRPAGKPKLDAAVEALKANTRINVEIHGYTDNQGHADRNQKLSKARAEAVKDYLVKRGIDAKRLSAYGHGPADPVDTNDTAAGRANNRRVELVIK